VPPKDGQSVSIRFAKEFPADPIYFSAGWVANFIEKNSRCEDIGIRYLESVSGEKQVLGVATDPSYYRFEVCAKDAVRDPVLMLSSEYSLHLGETSSRASAPWNAASSAERMPASKWMSRISARLIAEKSGEVLAEDVIFLQNFTDDAAGCPIGLEQIADLLKDVFGSDPPFWKKWVRLVK
jgi:hypothetical protein